MPSGLDTFSAVKSATANKPPGSDHWLTIHEKLDLCKLTAPDLIGLGIEAHVAEAVASALNRQQLDALGKAMGRQLRVKFRVWAERDATKTTIRCDEQSNAEWLRDYLRQRFANSVITDPRPCGDSSGICIDVTFDDDATPFALRQALLECPAASIVWVYDVRVADQPHYRLEAFNLAAWLESHKDEERWWTVDGDPLLMSRLEFPAPPDELAVELRRVNKPLLVADPSGDAGGEELTPEDVDRAMSSDEWGNRMLMVSWESGSADWQLIEDEPTSEGSTD